MSDVSSSVTEPEPRQDRSNAPRVVRWGLAGLALSAVGVVAMPSPPSQGLSPEIDASKADAPETDVDARQRAGQGALPAGIAAISPETADPGDVTPGADTSDAPPAGNGVRPEDIRMAALYRLVDEICGVTPERVVAGPDALTIDLPLAGADHPCLDEVALMFDREHPGAPQLLFDVLAAKEERGLPVLHISAMHTGPLPYLHLKSGETLFVGAIVDGWELASIDENGAAFTYGDRTFTLNATADERQP